jgi:hypothetical protein
MDVSTGPLTEEEAKILDEAMVETPWNQLSRRKQKKLIRAAYERACKEELCKPKEELDKTTVSLPQRPAIYGLHQYKMKNSKGPAYYKSKETIRRRMVDNIHPMDPMRSIAEALDLREEQMAEFIGLLPDSQEVSDEQAPGSTGASTQDPVPQDSVQEPDSSTTPDGTVPA